jgi:hypothetical protein
LDGTDDCVDIPDAPALQPASLTLEVCVALDAQPGIRVIFAKPLGGGNKDSYAVWVDSGTLKGVVTDAAGLEGPVLITSFSPVSGRWYHVA